MLVLSCLRRLCAVLIAISVAFVVVPAAADDLPPAAVVTTPVVTGEPAVGDRLDVDPASVAGWSSPTYQWFVAGLPVAGADTASFVPAPEHVGEVARVEVSGVPEAGTETVSASSADTLRIQLAPVPTIGGVHAVGSTLTAYPSEWSFGTALSFRWYADAKPITGASASTFRLGSAQAGRRIHVVVTGQRDGFATLARTSARSAKTFTVATTPKIKGSSAVSRKLTLDRGSWMTGATLAVRWYADGDPIRNATRTTFTIPSSLVGKRITVGVTGSRSGYETVAKTSKSTARVQRVGTPSLSGSAVATRRMTVRVGTWTSGTSFRYQWFLNDKKISGATSSSIGIKPSWKGKRLRASVTGSRSEYSTFTVKTSSSARISLPSRTAPVSSYNCPSWAPIKGNESSMIYHVPGQRFYKATKPEDCFRTESAARSAGYRKAKV